MTGVAVAFGVGVVSSLVATAIVLSRGRLRFRMQFRRLVSRIVELVGSVTADGFQPDLVITIDRNSGVVGSIMAAHLGLAPSLSVGTENIRKPDGTRSVRILEPFLPSLEVLGGRNVLLVICCNDTGTSLGHVLEHIQSRDQPPLEVRTCALFSSISPGVKPRYVGVTVGRDTKKSMAQVLSSLPWVTDGWRFSLAEERHGSQLPSGS